MLFKTGICALINTKRHKTALLKERKAGCDGRYRAGGSGCYLMVSAGQIPEIEYDTGNSFRLSAVSKMSTNRKEQEQTGRKAEGFKPHPGGRKCLLLNVKGEYPAVFSHKAGKEQGIVPVSGSGVDAEITWLHLKAEKMMAPFGDC